jgi:hypothetical protein
LNKQSIVEEAFSTDTVFCRSLVSEGFLTEQQMQQAARRYRLGRSKDGGVIFWEIDEMQKVRDGKIMFYHDDCHRDHDRHPDWVSTRLKAHYGYTEDLPVDRCLFGLHLLPHTDLTDSTDFEPLDEGAAIKQGSNISVRSVRSVCHKTPICVVEAEKTAVILSELFPQAIWLASGGLSMLNVAKLYPLRDYRVVLFPDTDPEGKAFQSWRSIATTVQEHFKYPIRVSRLLEDHASPSQKSAKIDLVDFLFS